MSHDLIFKTACRYFFGDVVELTRPDLARRLDLSEVELLEQEAFSDFPEGERSIADLVAKARLKDGSERILLIQVEVEGEFRRAMDERAFFYYLHLRLKYRLPLVTIVIFLKGGKTPLEVREVVDEVGGVEVCRFRYMAFCLRPSRAEDFVDRPQALAPAFARGRRRRAALRAGEDRRCLCRIGRDRGGALRRRGRAGIQQGGPTHGDHLERCTGSQQGRG